MPRFLVIPLCGVWVLMGLAGCDLARRDEVLLTRMVNEPPGPARFRWVPRSAVFKADARGRHELLAESPPAAAAGPVHQWLHVKVLWPIRPTRTGSDETALNAHISYLVRTDRDQPAGRTSTGPEQGGQAEARTLYYEGTGNVFVDSPFWLAGKARFTIRHAILRLARASSDQPADPFGQVLLEAKISASADPDADKAIGELLGLVGRLRVLSGQTNH